MTINHTEINPAFYDLINKPNQVITLDANFLIAPNRNISREFPFFKFKEIWLD